MSSLRRIRPLAALALVASAVGTLLVTAPTAQASWFNELQACKNAYGSEVYMAWEIPTVVLAKGSSGVCVRELQEELLEAGAVRSEDRPGFVDGQFGPKTYNAVVNFQRSGSTQGGPDGIVGIKAWGYLIPAAEG
ncbi:peptidoglycan-binding protein [Streptomyces sp. NPDC001584]|uniref:peptidoglycan-binding domain-containing protein n=1 Tax=Streptomyces sp. NPDC001584 TaxID=3154521 RepID=UPI00332CB6CF